MNKLSDEKLKEMEINFLNGSMEDANIVFRIAAKQVRSYFHAQIDAQAKTMEELLEIYDLGGIIKQGVEELNHKVMAAYKEKYGMLSGWKTFADLVSFFIAAGGTIKE